MSSLQLNLLGSFETRLDEQTVENPGVKTQALLIYLAVERERPQRREHLFTLLWSGMPEKSARHNLSQTLYALRQILPEQEDTPLLLVDRQTVQLNPAAGLTVDLHQLDGLLAAAQTHPHSKLAACPTCFEILEQAVDLYKGDFLSDFYLEDSNAFEEWAEAVREAYRRKVIEALSTLADIAIHKGEYERACTLIDRQLTFDNLRERTHRQKMEILALAGRRVEALRQYRELFKLMAEHLDVSPSQETTALYERIRSENLAANLPRPETAPPKAATPRHNLLPQTTPFIGRQDELARLDEMLRDPHICLITIVAPGGMGKTRLAIACAERQLKPSIDDGGRYLFPDGVFFVRLAPLNAPDQIPLAIANALNVSLDMGGDAQTAGSLLEKLAAYLHNKHILLVLDNFEHLLEGAELLSEILQAAPSLRILVTARERLQLQEEQIFSLVGLVYPDWEAPEESFDYTAIEMFLQSARRVRPDFALSTGDMTYLTRICNLVGGMPLALELAAAWVDLLSLAEITAEIQRSLDFLATDLRNLPERHRSMRAVFDATWARLTEIEKKVFPRLSVFQSGFNRAAVQEVCAATLRDLAGLASKSLIQFNPSTERYQIHELLRQYGIDRLKENSNDDFETRQFHSNYFCTEMEKHAKTFESGKTQSAIELIESDFANFRIAWDWVISKMNINRVNQIIVGFCNYYEYSNRNPEALSLCQDAIKMLQRLENLISTSHSLDLRLFKLLQAKVFTLTGWYNLPKHTEAAKAFFKKSSQTISDLDKFGIDTRTLTAHLLSYQALIIDDYHSAKILWLESFSLAQETQDFYRILYCYFRLGVRAISSGLFEEAKDWFLRGLTLAEEQHNNSFEVCFLIQLGQTNRKLGFYDLATQYYKNAFSKAQVYGLHLEEEDSIRWLSDMVLFLGDLERAKEYLEQAIIISDKYKFNISDIRLSLLGITEWLLGDFENAEKSITSASNLFGNPQYSVNLFPFVCEIELLMLLGSYEAAKQLLLIKNKGLKTIDYSFFKSVYARFLRTLSWLSLLERDYLQAKKSLEESIMISKKQKDSETTAWTEAFLSRAELGLGNYELSKNFLVNALSVSIEIQGYIPLVFTLPISLLILGNDDYDFAVEVYKQIRSDPFMSKAQLFHDLVYKHLPEKITAIPVEIVENNAEHRDALWETARLVLEKWMQ